MSKKRVGIDLGSTAVRVVEVDGVDDKNMPKVTAVGIASMPPGAIQAGRVIEIAQVADAIKRAFAQTKISRYGAVIGVASPAVALAQVTIPSAVLPHEWENVAKMQGLKLNESVPVQDAVLSFQKLREDERNITLAISGVLKEEITTLMEVCKKAKVYPRAIDLAPAATFRGLVPVASSDVAGVAALVDIGATKTTVVVRQGPFIRSVRTIEQGGEAATRSLMGALQTRDFETADELKASIDISATSTTTSKSQAAKALEAAYGDVEERSGVNPDAELDLEQLARTALTSATDSLIESILVALEEDSTKFPDAAPNSILLAGRGSLLAGLPAQLQARIETSTFLPRPYIRVVPSSKVSQILVDKSPSAVKVLEIVTATGLAQWTDGVDV